MAPETPLVGQVLGHYRVLEQIGAGGMGLVFRASDEQLERDVAIKVLPPGMLADEAARKRFRREALTLAKLNPPIAYSSQLPSKTASLSIGICHRGTSSSSGKDNFQLQRRTGMVLATVAQIYYAALLILKNCAVLNDHSSENVKAFGGVVQRAGVQREGICHRDVRGLFRNF